eukprot:COSAG02_NODE_6305_length_3665_cov_126.598990_4_plen_27_part_01
MAFRENGAQKRLCYQVLCYLASITALE